MFYMLRQVICFRTFNVTKLLIVLRICSNVYIYICLYYIGGARVKNILYEEIVGLFSSLKHRSPNATIINLASKIKATKNQT